jgi:hypothetical protein
MRGKTDLRIRLKAEQRLTLFGRLRMAELIEMPEGDFAGEIEKIEKDPLFKKLYLGTVQEPGIIRRQRWPHGRFSGTFYEINEQVLAGGERVRVEEGLGERASLVSKIRRMGREAFERYFLYAEEALPLEEIARRTGLSSQEIGEINDFLVDLGAQVEFARPEKAPPGRAFCCLARISVEGEAPEYEFFSPYWARGLYHIRYDLLERWKQERRLDLAELKKLPHLLKRMETVNLRQNTLFRVLESLIQLQSDFLKTRREDLRCPVSLRGLARRLDLAPSTISRALSGRSVLLPWGKETPLISLVPGRRPVLREVLARSLEEDPRGTDASLAERLKTDYGIRVSRRTVNAVRHELGKSKG